MGCRVLFARMHFDPQADAQVRHKVTVINMAWPPGFMWVVADLRSLLMAVETLHCGIDVEYPRQAQHRADARQDVTLQPAQTLGFIHPF